MVGDSLASRGSEISLEEVLSNAVYFSIFQKYLNEHKLVDGKLLPFMQELSLTLTLTLTLNLTRTRTRT